MSQVYEYQVHDNIVYTRHHVDTIVITPSISSFTVIDYIDQYFHTEKGQWVVKHGKNIRYCRLVDPLTFQINLKFFAYLTPENITFFKIKYSA